MRCENFKALLERVRVGHTTSDDAEKIMKLHHVFYKVDKEFKDKIENHKKTMWLFTNKKDVREKMPISLFKYQQETSSQLQG